MKQPESVLHALRELESHVIDARELVRWLEVHSPEELIAAEAHQSIANVHAAVFLAIELVQEATTKGTKTGLT